MARSRVVVRLVMECACQVPVPMVAAVIHSVLARAVEADVDGGAVEITDGAEYVV
jgi:hypothetical protein